MGYCGDVNSTGVAANVKGLVNGRPFGIISVTEFGTAGNGVKDDSASIKRAIDTLKANGGGIIVFPLGVYRIGSDLIYDLVRTKGIITFIGLGSFGNCYDPLNSGGSVLYFDGGNFDDGLTAQPDWNTAKGVLLQIENMGLVFKGNSVKGSVSKGKWIASYTLPILNNVSIAIIGAYEDNATVIYFRGSGPIGKTAKFDNFDYYPMWTTGNYVTGMRCHFDSFKWTCGSAGTNFGSAVYEPRLLFIDAVSYAEVEKIIVFRSDSRPTTFFLLAQSETSSSIRFTDFHVAYSPKGSVLKHFQGTHSGITVIVDECNFEGGLVNDAANVTVKTVQYA